MLPLGLLCLHFFWGICRMYYRYWFYTTQGVTPTFTPWPILGTNPQWLKNLPKGSDEHPMIDVFNKLYGDNVPPVLVDFRIPNGFLLFSDPEYIHELYVTKNKYFDKGGRMKNQMKDLFGESILLDASNEWHSLKRKHMSAAFYKDKMIKMLDNIMAIAHTRIETWKEKYVQS